MKNIFGRMIVCIALQGLVSLSFVNALELNQSSVPFKGNGKAEIVSVVPGPTGVLMTAVAKGNATHLGKYSRVENIVLGEGGSFTGDVVFTAANGEQLSGTIIGAFTSPSTASGSYTFNGGTGRFVNATGVAHFTVSLTDPVRFNVEFNGSIDF